MNNILMFLIGYFIGSVVTYAGIMLYAKNVSEKDKEMLKKRALKKWEKKK